MTVTLIATPEPNNIPPRVRLDMATNDPTKSFSVLSVKRDGKVIREQPFPGSAVALAYDYEAPFGIPVTYSMSGEMVTPVPSFATTWPNLSGWSTVSGSPAVAGGNLVSGRVSRTLTLPATGKLTLSGPIDTSSGSGQSDGGNISVGAGLNVSRSFSSPGTFITFNGVTKGIATPTGPLVLTWDTDGLRINGSSLMPGAWNATSNVVQAGVQGAAVPGFSIESTGVGTHFSASDTDTLNSPTAWLIHPSQPSLSKQIDQGPSFSDASPTYVDASTAGVRTSQAQSTVHRPVGRSRPVVITSGPRQADEWSLILGTPTSELRNGIRAIVDDQTPLLLRAPASFDWDLPDDWYSIGDVSMNRSDSPFVDELTTVTLPLTPVDEPIVRQGALWTYGTDLLAHPTYADSLAALPTYLDRLAGSA